MQHNESDQYEDEKDVGYEKKQLHDAKGHKRPWEAKHLSQAANKKTPWSQPSQSYNDPHKG